LELIKDIEKMRGISRKALRENKTVGFVPTMGFLHEGHLELVEKAVMDNDLTVVSIFVNPTQFGENEDFDEYPRDLERDLGLLEKYNVDYVFFPRTGDIYPEDFATYVQVEKGTDVLCGKSRPGHFKGVTTVVTKLFNIVEPDRAYFGQKDGQQLLLIQKITRELNLDIEIVGCPTVREEDGLALSSRNKYLSTEERKAAKILYSTLKKAQRRIEEGERDGEKIQKIMEEEIAREPLARLDYASVVKRSDLSEAEKISGPIMIAIAVFFGSARLIDNIWMEVE